MRYTLALLLGYLVIVGCATTHPGYMAEKSGDDQGLTLAVSGRIIPDMSDKYHQFVDFTFENTGASWLRFSQIDFKYGTDQQDASSNIIVGKDLATWAEAMANRRAKEEHNAQVAAATVAVVGAAVAAAGATSNDNTATLIGLGVYTSAAIIAVSSEIHNELLKLNSSKTVPASHLLSPFSVPADNFIRRWIVINAPKKEIPLKVEVVLTGADGLKQKYLVPIRSANPSTRSNP